MATTDLQAPTTRPGRTARILFAEDNPTIRTLFSKGLRKAGFEVAEVSDGLEFLSYLTTVSDIDEELALIVTDLQMPVSGGEDILAALRSNRWKVPVLLFTGTTGEESRRLARQMGASLLEKPVNIEKFIATCRAMIAVRTALAD